MLFHELDPHTTTSQRLHKSTKIVEIAGQPIHTVDYDRVAIADEFEQLLELRPENVFARGLVGENLVDVDPIELSLGVLVEAAYADVANPLSVHEPSLGWKCQAGIYESRLAVSRKAKSGPILTGQAFGPDIRMGSTPY